MWHVAPLRTRFNAVSVSCVLFVPVLCFALPRISAEVNLLPNGNDFSQWIELAPIEFISGPLPVVYDVDRCN